MSGRPADPSMYLQFHLTRRCNLACSHCYEPGRYFADGTELSTDECRRILREFTSFCLLHGRPGMVYLTGGEPLLRPDIFELLRACRDCGLSVRLLTNGTLVDAAAAAAISECRVSAVQVSLDGLEATHDSMRGPGTFSRAVAGIGKLVGSGVPVTVMTTVSRQNAGELRALWDQCLGLGVRRLAFGRLVPAGRGAGLAESLLSAPECLEVFSSALAFEPGAPAELVKRDPLWRIFDHLSHPGCSTVGCSIGRNGLCVLQNGDVLPCRRLPVVVGNLKDSPIHSIWTGSPVLAALRERRLEGECGGCDLKQKCGGCRGIAYALTGNYLSPDPQCFRGLVMARTA